MKIIKQGTSSGRERAALALAMIADVVQIGLFPIFVEGAFSYLNDALDVIIAIAMFLLLGWHWVLLPSMVAELVPMLNIVPTWTAAVALILRMRGTLPESSARRSLPAESDEAQRNNATHGEESQAQPKLEA